LDALPAAFPFWIGEEAAEHLGVQIAFTFEIAVEATMRQAGPSHDLVNGDAFKAVAIEELACTLNDLFLYCRTMTRRVGQLDLLAT
jgi:hypothetical protein